MGELFRMFSHARGNLKHEQRSNISSRDAACQGKIKTRRPVNCCFDIFLSRLKKGHMMF
jgi:hypothetical protein